MLCFEPGATEVLGEVLRHINWILSLAEGFMGRRAKA